MGSRKSRRYGRGQPDEARKRVGPVAAGGVKRIGCPCSRTASPLPTPELGARRRRGCSARRGDAAREEVSGRQCSSMRADGESAREGGRAGKGTDR
jgi:hypothetical protein